MFSFLRPVRVGALRYIDWRWRDKPLLYAEWGDGVMLHLFGRFGLRFAFRAWRIR